MNKLQKMFRSNLADKYIELAGREADRDDFMIGMVNELRQEFEQGSEADKIVTYNKLFLVFEV
jgi:hypothetical protein